jgi:prevent-host-death family protein
MTQTITASEANQAFSKLLRLVQAGEDFVVMSRGRAVARVVPYVEGTKSSNLAGVVQRLKKLPIRDLPNWTRDDLYQ